MWLFVFEGGRVFYLCFKMGLVDRGSLGGVCQDF